MNPDRTTFVSVEELAKRFFPHLTAKHRCALVLELIEMNMNKKVVHDRRKT